MRLFVAIDIPDDVRQNLAAFIAKLRGACREARWVRPEGMHLTLKFIGEVAPEKLAGIEAALRPAQVEAAMDLIFRGVGFFPNVRRPRVFWVMIEAPPQLAALAADIDARLEPLGSPRENRAFRPHLTLARFDSHAGVPRLRDALAKLGLPEFGRTSATEFHLYESQLQRGGAIYTRLATFQIAERKASVP